MIPIERLRREFKVDERELEELQSSATSIWETATKRFWKTRVDLVESKTVYPEMSFFYLKLSPVTSITQVRELAAKSTEWTVLTADEDYLLTERRRLNRISTTTDCPSWARHVEVTYSGGVDVADPEIQEALILQLRYRRERYREEVIAHRQKSHKEAGSTSFLIGDYHPEFRRIAQHHRRHS